MERKEANKKEIFVFLGPTLSAKKAAEILPEARFFPPISYGNIIQVLRLNPKIILIIDGRFNDVLMVQSKEILYALSENIQVYGAGGAGAIKASELCSFGMIGVGKIFKYYNRIIMKDIKPPYT